MSVKNIFKILISVPVIIVVSSLIVEFYNVNVTGLQITSISKMAARQACVLFSQETYKSSSEGRGAGNMPDVVDENGNEYVSGIFYSNLDAIDLYTSLYTTSEFESWLNSEAVVKGNWNSLELIKLAVNNDPLLNKSFPGWDASQSEKDDYDKGQLAKMYRETMVTPLNMGVPYLDKTTVSRMFRWNLAQLMSNCMSENIHIDDSGEQYVMFKGYRIYASKAQITNLDYVTYDLTDPSDKVAFEELTHIKAEKLGYEYSAEALGIDNDERMRVCVVGVEYSVPIAYEGITPLKNVFAWVWTSEVKGLDGTGSIDVSYTWNDSTQTLTSGGRTGDSELPTTGILVYYIVR